MKEPKEEAERIIFDFYKIVGLKEFSYDCEPIDVIKKELHKFAQNKTKQCAILHVEGIVKLVSYPQTNIKRKKYWQEVLQIIKDK
jgi:hypothetical protein